MSLTLRIVNGQIDIDPSTGQVNTVEGNRKAAQDMGNFLLQDYLEDNASGSYLREVAQNPIPQAGDLFLRYYIAECIQRLQSKQQEDTYLTEAEQIVEITELLVNTDPETNTTTFYLSVATADGGVEPIAATQETQMNHQYERF